MTEWFRNTTWDTSIERAFDDKLRRARRKEQYLRIQACTLARSHPDVALYVAATCGVQERYARALELLLAQKSRLTFPVDHFRWHAARALICAAALDAKSARAHAQQALEAVSREHSGFRYHASAGLVTKQYDEVVEQLEALRAE